MIKHDKEYLTLEAHERLTAELEERKTVRRTKITKRIEEARAHGDLRENAEYHAAKDEQGLNEAEIRTLEARLRRAVIGRPEVAEGVVAVGMVIEIEDADGDVEAFFLGSRDDRVEGLEVVGASSPMGKALTGARVGDTVSYAGPRGTRFEVTVRSAQPR